MHSPQLNWLLAQLPEDDYERLSQHLELVGLDTGKQLFHTGQQHTDIFFPTTCTVSAQIELEQGDTTDIYLLGPHGFFGTGTTHRGTFFKAIVRKPEHILVIGWSSMGRSVITELAAYLPKGSSVHIVAQNKFVAPAELADLKFGGVKVTYASVNGDIHELIAAASAKKYNEVIILGYRNAISEAEADAQTMLTMLQMNQLFEADGNGVDPTRLVAEILDSRKAELARVAAVDDLVVSDNLAALLISQVSENPALAPVFDDLFDADGAAINVKPIEHYVPVGKKTAYAELVAIAAAHGESAIGYRVVAESANDASTGVRLNPAKTTEFTPAKGDSLIVIGDVE